MATSTPRQQIRVPAGHEVVEQVQYGVKYPDEDIQWLDVASGVDLSTVEHQKNTQTQYDYMLVSAKLPAGAHRVGFTSRTLTQIQGPAEDIASLIEDE